MHSRSFNCIHIGFALINKVSNIIMVEGNLLESHLIIAKKVAAYTDEEFQSYVYKLRAFGSMILRIEIENVSNLLARYLARDYKAFDSDAARSLCKLVLHQFEYTNFKEEWTSFFPKIQVIYGSGLLCPYNPRSRDNVFKKLVALHKWR